MKRRAFLQFSGPVLAGMPLCALAQSEKTYRIGALAVTAPIRQLWAIGLSRSQSALS